MSLGKFSKRQLLSFGVLVLILFALPLGIIVVKNEQRYQGGAEGPESIPFTVKISNLHGGGFSVSWKTDNDTNGSVKFGTTDSLANEALDDRGNILSTTHHVTITQQNPSTNYYFKIKSGPTLYGKAADGTWLASAPASTQTTPPELQPSAPPNPIFGNIKNQSGAKVEGALIYIYFQKAGGQKSALLSAVTNPGWVVDTKNARAEDLQSLFILAEGDTIKINVEAAEKGVGEATTTAGNCIVNGCEAFQDIIVSVPLPTSTPTTPVATSTPTQPQATSTPTTPVATSTPTTPQATGTPTPTIEPGATTLSFKVRFQGIPDNRANEKKISVILKQEGIEKYALPEVSITGDANGVYTTANLTLPDFTAGRYDIFVKGWCHLTKKFSGDLVSGSTTLDFSAADKKLLTGNAENGDDAIDIDDFQILANGYSPKTTNNADFDLSEEIDIDDFQYLANNYGKGGDQ